MPPPPLQPPPWTPADPAALRDVLAQAKVAERMPGPSWFDYVGDIGRALQERFFGALERLLPWSGLPIVERIALYSALGAAIAAVLAVLVVALRRWRAMRGRRERTIIAAPLPVAAPTPQGDVDWWQAELRRRLAADALRPALEAAWWWTARRLDPPALDPSWTTGDLLRRSGAAVVRAPLRRLDRQLWGGGAVRRDEVESVVAELEGALP